MADGHPVTDQGWFPGIHMHDDAILEVGALPDADRSDVPTEDRPEPDTRARADLDIADDHRIRCDKNIRRDTGKLAPEGQDRRHAGSSLVRT